MYLHLYHGRTDPDQDMEDWGTEGPIFGPLTDVLVTYASHIRLFDKNDKEFWLNYHDDMVYYDNVFYGDWCVVSELRNEETPMPLPDQKD